MVVAKTKRFKLLVSENVSWQVRDIIEWEIHVNQTSVVIKLVIF